MSAPPIASRPQFANLPPPGPGAYLLPWSWAEARLAAARNFWVATVHPDGAPHAMPVWGVWQDGAVLFDTHPRSRKARNLSHDGRTVVHLESGEEAVILEGRVDAEEELAAEALDRFLRAYAEKYDWQSDEPFVFRPRVAYAWRNAEYRDSVTRFAFT